MTAVEWLNEKLILKGIFFEFELLEQAKEMEKQQIIDAWIATDNKLQRMAAEKYYNETYGSKGIDDHIVNTNKMVSSQN